IALVADEVEQAERVRADLPLHGLSADAGESRPDRSGGGSGEPDLHVLDHRHALEELGRLERAPDPGARHAVRPDTVEGALTEAKAARGGSIEAAEDVEQRGLPGAVGADHAVDGAGLQTKVPPGEGREATEAHVETSGLERHRRGGAGRPRRRRGPVVATAAGAQGGQRTHDALGKEVDAAEEQEAV